MKKSLPDWIWYVSGVVLLILLFVAMMQSPNIDVQQKTTKVNAQIPLNVVESTSDLLVIEFVDYQCPYCAQSRNTLSQVKERFVGQNLDFQTHHYPLATVHPQAVDAAITFECAKTINKSEQIAEWMFTHQNALDQSSLKTQLQTLGVQNPQNCFEDQQIKNIIASDISLGNVFGVQGTPTFVIVDPQNTTTSDIFEGNRQVTELSNAILERLQNKQVK
ncbi:MAG TPA: thioredoxin domain-containing protein [Acidobacteriota bacterium]|nr:thioredoxin domain-containing protein [Acidobacteriota bacterium]